MSEKNIPGKWVSKGLMSRKIPEEKNTYKNNINEKKVSKNNISDNNVYDGNLFNVNLEISENIVSRKDVCEDNVLEKLFEKQVCENPKNLAVKTEATALTYEELNQNANRVAHEILGIYPAQLSQKEQKKEVIGLLFEHGPDMIVGVIGAVKSGKIYVPLNPGYPEKRLVYILEDSGASVIVTNNRNYQLAKRLQNQIAHDLEILNLSLIENNTSVKNPDVNINPDEILYILYTSGSTGKPKGVIQTRRNVVHFVKNYARSFQITSGDRMTLFSAFSHDAAVMDIYSALLNGATLYPLNIKEQKNLEFLANWLIKEKINIYHSVPTVYRYFTQTLRGEERFPDLRYVVLGGEKVIEHDVVIFKEFFKDPGQTVLVNLYGQSESSYNSSQFFGIDTPFEKITLGQPIEGTEILVLNEEGEEVGPFEIGEIFIASDYVAPGYWRDEDKTRKAFGQDPELGRLYRTGDLGRLQLDGSIEFIGRKDFQVKIRGFRVELGEIETRLLTHELVKDAAVVVQEKETGENHLCAFITTFPATPEPDEKDYDLTKILRQSLLNSLPDYMVPTFFVTLDKLPLTPTGKVDYRTLQEMAFSLDRTKEYVAPGDEVEAKLADILQEILHIEQIGIDDDFFELGIHSLRAINLIAKIYKEFNAKLPLKEVFKTPTIRELAQRVKESGKSPYRDIEPVEEKDFYPVSSAQKRLFLLDQISGPNTGYNMPGVMKIKGELDQDKFYSTIHALVKRHEVLRTSILMRQEAIVQQISWDVDLSISFRKISRDNISELVKNFIRPFDLSKGPLFRVGFFKIKEADDEHILIFDVHHIIADGTSMNILVRDFVDIYGENELIPLRIQYKDFANWQNQLFASELFLKQEQFWLDNFSGEIPILNLPTDFPRKRTVDLNGDVIRFRIDRELTSRIYKLAKKRGVTLYMVLLAVYNVLLSRYSGQDEIIVGTPVAGRLHPDLENLIGMFVNTLALKNHLPEKATFEEFLDEVSQRVLLAFENQDYQFDMLVEKLDLARDMGRNPLFDTMLVLQNFESASLEIGGLKFTPYKFENPTTRFDLTLTGMEYNDELHFRLEYRTGLFKRETIERMVGHLINIFKEVTDNPEKLLSRIKMLSWEEENLLVNVFNSTRADYPEDRLVHQLFSLQAEQTPRNIAVIFGDERITYQEIERRSNQLARLLREKGVNPERIIGIMVEPSSEMVIALLATLKAGGAYIPVDPGYPDERLRFILDDSGMDILLTQRHLREKVSSHFTGEVISIGDEISGNFDGGILDNITSISNLAYVIYTSGSTGRPKGVMIEHGSFLNFICWLKGELDLSLESRFLQVLSYSFDGFISGFYPPLVSGGSVVLLRNEDIKDPMKIRQEIINKQITHFVGVPSLYQALLEVVSTDDIRPLKQVILGGEELSPSLVEKSRQKNPHLELFNAYGPTESTVTTTSLRNVYQHKEISIGKPIANTQVYVLDKESNLLPIGVIGELCIGGKGLAREYLNRPELTREKFLANPLNPEERIYRTGDLARWLPDGSLQFAGRIDHQVKIRGYRIELEEIKNKLLSHPMIGDAVVVDLPDNWGTKVLCAYIVPHSVKEPENQDNFNFELTFSELRSFLAETLPEYMIPSYFVVLDKIPLTANGKVDRKALPEPDGEIYLKREYVEPTNEIETELVRVWKEILQVKEIGVTDNFFELGGHSLKATSLVSRISKIFNVEIPLREVFKKPTIQEMANYIQLADKEEYLEIKPEEKAAYYPVSSAQKRIYILEQFENMGTSYNMPMVMIIEGKLNVQQLSEAFHKLVQHHEILRTSFEVCNGETVQIVNDEVDFAVLFHEGFDEYNGDIETFESSNDFNSSDSSDSSEIKNLSRNTENVLIKTFIKNFIKPFDLSKAPLFRVGIQYLGSDKYLLIIDMHHIISDGTSMEIIMDEVLRLYSGEKLLDNKIQYKDFAVWQRKYLQSKKIKAQEAFWLSELAGDIPVLNMPTDYPRPSVLSHEGDGCKFVIEEELTKRLNELAIENGATLYMVLLGIYSITLAKYASQEEILIGTVLAGRTHADIENTIGLFLNNIIFRCKPLNDLSFKEYLGDLKNRVLNAYENQEYPIEELIDKLNPEFDMSRNALFDVMLILQNFSRKSPERKPGGLKIKPYSSEKLTAKYDLTLYVTELDSKLYLNLEYCTRLFKRETMERFSHHLINVARQVTLEPELKIASLQLITEEEKKQILGEFNKPMDMVNTDLSVAQLFSRKAHQLAEKTAVVSNGYLMSYGELNQRANQLAYYLRKLGINSEKIVAVLVERSPEMIVSLMGCLKSGGAYLPVDPDYPEERIQYILKDSKAEVLITQNGFIESGLLEKVGLLKKVILIDRYGTRIIEDWIYPVTSETGDNISGKFKKSFDEQFDGIDQVMEVNNSLYNIDNPIVGKDRFHNTVTKNNNSGIQDNFDFMENYQPAKPGDLAYIIYTSGSTGKPKGVMVEHGSLLAYLDAFQQEFKVTVDDVVLQQASYSFDAFVEEMYPVLLNGGKLVIAGKDEITDPVVFREILEKNQVTMISCSPLLLRELNSLPPVKSIRTLISGGDVLKGEYITNLVKTACVYNTYGPTESTVCATYYRCPEVVADNIPIGKPITNYQVYIMDTVGNLLPIGVPGELWISGPGVARGYLNREELTQEKFIPNPFVPGERIYRTGDLGKWLADGNIQFLGRVDNQVKIRGYRIEPGEIEKQLLKHPAIKEGVVIDRIDRNGEKYLCGYIILNPQSKESKGSISIQELRDYLLQELPAYMIPTHFMILDRIPLTTSGKVDRKALPEPDDSLITGTEYIAPRTGLEESLVRIWSEVLDRKGIGINDNFFTLGGHSLKATALVAKVNKVLQVELPLREVFKNPTIRELAAYLEKADTSIYGSIEKVDKQEYYPVSSAQKRMYLLNQLQPENTGYNLPGFLIIEGNLDKNRLDQVFTTLVKRHEAFRTSFTMIDDQVVQRIEDSIDFQVSHYEPVKEEKLSELVKVFVRPFNLAKAPLLRVGLVPLKDSIGVDNQRYLLMFDMHHIISDGYSVDILNREFLQLYGGEELPELRIQYKDFAVWQNQLFASKYLQKQEEYWLQKFDYGKDIPVLNLPTDFKRPVERTFSGSVLDFKIDLTLKRKLEDLAREHSATMYMVLLSAYTILMAKYSAQEDIVVGSPIAGRPHADLDNIIGMFVNTLTMRNEPEGNKKFSKFLQEVKENSLKAYENQDYQFEMLVEKLDVKRDLSRNPLFDVVFALQNTNHSITTDIPIPGCNISIYKTSQSLEESESLQAINQMKGTGLENKVAKFDLTLFAYETAQGINFSLEYSTELFTAETASRLSKHFIHLLGGICKNPEAKIAELELITLDDREEILHKFNSTDAPYPVEKTVQQLFEEQVIRTPDKLALVFKDERLNYDQLNKKANQLAHRLRQKGVGQETIVGLMTDRCLEMIIGILAIVKAGGAYLPFDLTYPESRVQYMLEDSEAGVFLVDDESRVPADYRGEVLNLKDADLYRGDSENLENINKPDDLIYIIYTSGSTGKPKGVMALNRGVNRLVSNDNIFKITCEDRLLQVTSIAFDAATFEIWCTLCNGGELYMVEKEKFLSVKKIKEEIRTNKINIIWLTTSLFNQLLEQDPDFLVGVEKVYTGGEVASPEHFKLARNHHPGLKIFNCYGPTENTTFTTCFLVDGDYDDVPIGKPISNTRVYIMDKAGHLLPIGVPGELVTAGPGLARGYLKRPELTAEKFVPDPFNPGELMYHTGDLARWLPDGNLQFLGRIDDQVKIRGYRIELGEIEKELLKHPAIEEVVVLVKNDENQNKYICAYFVAEKELELKKLREFLATNLPDYMIPGTFVQLVQMPLNANGKIDRQALPEPDGEVHLQREYVKPTNETEMRLVEIWKEVLHINEIGITDNFFELGGHSLKATSLMSRISKNFNVDISLRDIFRRPTIKELAVLIGESLKIAHVSISKVEDREYYPVSSAQKRQYILHQLNPDSTNYNMPGIFIIEGQIDRIQLADALQKLVKRHESLRTSFSLIDGEPVQKIHQDVEVQILDMGVITTPDNVIYEFVKPFDLAMAPLLRMGLGQFNGNYLLIFDMHHIISDGISMNILFKELMLTYCGNELPELRIQYKDFAVWQNRIFESEEFKKQEKYWLERFGKTDQGFSGIPVLNLPTDFLRPPVMNFEGADYGFILSERLTEDLYRLISTTDTTLYMVLLAAYNVLLAKYSRQEDIIVGSPIAGRPHSDLENLIGMFVNTLAMRNYPKKDKTFIQFLIEVKENALEAYENQEYQFEMLVEKLNLARDLSRNPLFDTMFVLQNMNQSFQLPDNFGLRIKPYQVKNNITKFDLALSAAESGGKIHCNFQYSTSLFSRGTVEQISRHFINILKNIVDEPEVFLSEISLISAEEKKFILEKFSSGNVDISSGELNQSPRYPLEVTLHQLFEEQVAKTPENIAVSILDEYLTYQELNLRANQLARKLRIKGVGPDEIVGILIDRSLEMAIGIMGILKAGAGYLPIDPKNPKERIMYMLQDSGVKVLLSKSYIAGKLVDSNFSGEIVDLGEETIFKANNSDNKLDNNFDNKLDSNNNPNNTHDNSHDNNFDINPNTSPINPVNTVKPDNLAYLIYTSGTTGLPKGVMVEHRGIINTLQFRKAKYNFKVRVLQLTSISFDAFCASFFNPLIAGGEVVFLPDEKTFDAFAIKDCLRSKNISNFICVPSFYRELLKVLTPDDVKSLELVFLGGEKLTPSVVERSWELNPHLKIVNEYGPTENSVISTYYRVDKKQWRIPIGRPISNTQVYILGDDLQILPIGVPGEICIGGVGLARGYLNRPELTREKFICIPQVGKRVYRTGDLGRWLLDGQIEYLGRIDQQVKIRGYRIEPEEIEKQILKYPGIKDAVVCVKGDDDNNFLIGYFISDDEISNTEISKHLAQRLPDYMVPVNFMRIEKIPLTSNGKIDYAKLPEPERLVIESGYHPPVTELQRRLANIWADILKINKVGIKANFFEIGGHSLKATSVISRIYRELDVIIPLQVMFTHPTIEKLAEYISQVEGQIYREIKKVEKRAYYPVSSAQKRMYVLNQLEGSSKSYNMPTALYIEGELDIEQFINAFRVLIQRHESLRTSFKLIDGEPQQIIHENVDFIPEVDEVFSREIEPVLKDFIQPFDLSAAPLLRVKILKLLDRPDRYFLMYDLHHIVADGTSIKILTGELISIYFGEKLPELRIQYKDFAIWQKEFLKSDELKKQEEYWLNVFKGEIPVLNLPTDYPRPSVINFAGECYNFTLDKEMLQQIKKLGHRSGATVYMVLLAVYNVVLAKYSGQEDIVVGSPIAGRIHEDLDNIIGMFANTLAMRNYPIASRSFIEFLTEVKDNALKAYDNQGYQFEMLVEKLNLERSLSRNPLFDTMLILQNTKDVELSSKVGNKLKFIPYEITRKTAKFDLILDSVETNTGIYFELEYSTQLFKSDTIKRFARHFVNVLDQVVINPEITLADISLITEEEKDLIISQFNKTEALYPKDKLINQFFEEQVEKTPEKVALFFEGQTLTYAELNQKANQLARLLRSKGVTADMIVGVMVDRSFEMVIGLLGVLKAGGAYLPIDPEYPKERITTMLEDSQTPILLTKSYLKELVDYQGTLICLDNQNIYSEDDSNLEIINTPDDLIYIIYTSGSTGKPKGVMLEHRNMVNLICFEYDKLNIDFSGKVLQFTTICFDVSFQEIFSTLLAGGELYLMQKETRDDFTELFNFIEKHQISILFLPVSFLKFVFNEEEYVKRFPRCVEHLITAGEQLIVTDALRNYLKENGVYLHNHYGPSETHLASTLTMAPTDEIPELPSIGKPLSNTRIYLLDEKKRLQPIGIPGELYVSGDNVGRGYLNQKDLTGEKFMVDPFRPEYKMYRTGDLARWLPDGNIQFIGRKDHQVKIRGYRVELEEIEYHLLNHPFIKEAVVIARSDNSGNNYLCAYFVALENHENLINVDTLRTDLAQYLPDYMIPSYFKQLKEIPLKPNGKADHLALAGMDNDLATGIEYVPPIDELERTLTLIWKEVLRIERVGVNDNFFTSGGHSLKATLLMAKINKEFDIQLPLRQIFKNPTIRGLAKYIRGLGVKTQGRYQEIKKVSEAEYYPLSSAQKRMFVVNQLNPESISYNLPVVVLIEGDLDYQRFEDALNKLVKRHEAFRTSFHFINGEVVQKIEEEVNLHLQSIKSKENELENLLKQFIKPFELSKAPLARVGLIETEENQILVFDMHHIISDGTSLNLIVQDLIQLYQGQELDELRLQYKDYAVWQNKMLDSREMQRQEAYWLEEFKGQIPLLNLPTDYMRPTIMNFVGDSYEFSLGVEVTEKIREVLTSQGVTLYMFLLAGLNILLARYSGQEDIIIGSPIAGRDHADLEKIVGMFVNTLAIRNYPEGYKSFIRFLKEVKDKALLAFENQNYQFELLIDKLEIERDMGRNPLFTVSFALQNTVDSQVELEGVKFKSYGYEAHATKFDLSFHATEVQNGISFSLTYRTDLFKKTTIERMAKHLTNIYSQVVNALEITLSEIELLTEEEKNQLIKTFNLSHWIMDEEETGEGKTIKQIFEGQVARNPDQLALICAGIEDGVMHNGDLTYAEVNNRANQLARKLIAKGVTSDTIVGLLVERSFEMMIGILAILKAGGAYLPIHPEYPIHRIRYMLQDSQAGVIMGDPKFTNNLDWNGEVINLMDENLYSGDSSNLPENSSSHNLVYLVYTSGSTGKPKGVMVEHASVINTLSHLQGRYQLGSSDIILQSTVYTFDASVREIFWWFFGGAKLCILPHNAEKDPLSILRAIANYQVTVIKFVPILLNEILSLAQNLEPDYLNSIRYVFVGGEALSAQTVNKFYQVFSPGQILCNVYGPTEATIHCTEFEITDPMTGVLAPLGHPISNVWIYVLDRHLKPVPINVTGEIYISGINVARGYINNPQLTAECFIPDPFNPGNRMYRSGDLGRWREDGKLEYMGRSDFQVKISGHRIEPGEIENRLREHPLIQEVVVTAQQGVQGQYLCAYLEVDRDSLPLPVEAQTALIEELKDLLARDLPDYMIPQTFMLLEELPLMPNGKINRKALPEVDFVSVSSDYLEPRDKIERDLQQIYQEVLGIDKIGIEEDFFELGGHSLMAIRAMVKASEMGYKLRVQDIFIHKTIQAIAAHIRGNEDGYEEELNEQISDPDLKSVKHINLDDIRQVDFEKDIIGAEKYRLSNVFLTGVTGFLGIHILAELLSSTTASIYCLVRSKDGVTAHQRLLNNLHYYFGEKYDFHLDQRIVVIDGDITSDNLGLTRADLNQVGAKVDTIIHSASLVKHFGEYAKFDNINVQGTRRIIDFALSNQSKLFYISTMSVAGTNIPGDKDMTFTENDLYIGQNYNENVYVKSKFEAENLIFKAVKEQGLKGCVLRVGNLTGRFEDGHFQINADENAFHNRLKALIQLKVVSSEMLSELLEFTPVDSCSKAIVKITQTIESDGRAFHLYNHNPIRLQELLSSLKMMGIQIRSLDAIELSKYLRNIPEEIIDSFVMLASYREKAKPSQQGKVNTDSTITRRYLNQLGFKWPEVDEEYIKKVIVHLCKIGFISA